MTTKRAFKSGAFKAIHTSVSAMHKIGAIDTSVSEAVASGFALT